MCGIIGMVGGDAPRFVVRGLKMLEYRGYDSSGIAVALGDSVHVQKGVGTIDRVVSVVPNGIAAVGHTRWATHGGVSDFNAHPHVDCSGRYAVVHNGIIDNHAELRDDLLERGHVFSSETDSEVLAHLFEEGMGRYGSYLDAFNYVVSRIRGQYAFAILTPDGYILAARNGAPLLVGRSGDSVFVSSDPVPLASVASEIYRLSDGARVILHAGALQILGDYVPVKNVSVRSVDLGNHAHYMEKEIYEQPRALKDTLEYLCREQLHWDLNGRIHLIAAGTSYHAALYGEYLLRRLGHDARAFVASEYLEWRGRDPDYVIAISQSGETEDVLSVLRNADGPIVHTITNSPGSTIEEYSDAVAYTRAGPELGVAATKTYTTALLALAGLLTDCDLSAVPRAVETVLRTAESEIRKYVPTLASARSAYFLGRSLDSVTAREASLKLKEIAYVHAEAYPAGESKHGPIALVEDGFPVVFVAHSSRLSDIDGNIHEMRARGASTVLVADVPSADISVPAVAPELFPIVSIVPLQLLAYHVAIQRGLNPDRPRNLAKSVTVK
ncbi:MAG: glutamine--fructose-6-phosphate transaminase (isomerizing) [Candidatus Diapherotrites archaeon]|nr:glutamine--fructose-6-phosphate transaminase (isomerizing) [Candidatus Diapherotrites archaeon]